MSTSQGVLTSTSGSQRDWGPRIGVGSHVGRGEGPGPPRSQREYTDGGLRGPYTPIWETPQIPTPTFGPGRSRCGISTLGLSSLSDIRVSDRGPCESSGASKGWMGQSQVLPAVQAPCKEGLRLLDPRAGRDPGPCGGSWRPQSRVSSLFTSGLGASGGEVLGRRAEASDPQG